MVKKFKRFIDKNGHRSSMCRNLPVEQVSWDTIENEFFPAANALLKPIGLEIDFHTEAQLEFMHRGRHGFKSIEEARRKANFPLYFTGNMLNRKFNGFYWHNANAQNKTHPVMSKRANDLGIFYASVLVWGKDYFGPYNISQEVSEDPERSNPTVEWGSVRVLRGLQRLVSRALPVG